MICIISMIKDVMQKHPDKGCKAETFPHNPCSVRECTWEDECVLIWVCVASVCERVLGWVTWFQVLVWCYIFRYYNLLTVIFLSLCGVLIFFPSLSLSREITVLCQFPGVPTDADPAGKRLHCHQVGSVCVCVRPSHLWSQGQSYSSCPSLNNTLYHRGHVSLTAWLADRFTAYSVSQD